jgi:DNA-binding CsgD family transcriptional regulator
MPGRGETGWLRLTNTEREIAAHVADGLTNQAIAERMSMSRHTLDSRLRLIFGKLHLTSRMALTRLVTEHRRAGDE